MTLLISASGIYDTEKEMFRYALNSTVSSRFNYLRDLQDGALSARTIVSSCRTQDPRGEI